MPVDRRTLLLALVGLGACGGGGGSPLATAGGGTTQSGSSVSRSTATVYPFSIYWPPGDPALRPTLPVVYLLDGEARFQTVDAVERIGARVIVIGVGNDEWRNRDDVPPNTYAAANAALPVSLYISYADNTGNAAFGAQVQSRGYAGLAMAVQVYAGGHIGSSRPRSPTASRSRSRTEAALGPWPIPRRQVGAAGLVPGCVR